MMITECPISNSPGKVREQVLTWYLEIGHSMWMFLKGTFYKPNLICVEDNETGR